MNIPSNIAAQLANKYGAPVESVERLMREETARITADARVTTFVPIFVARRVEEHLRTDAASRSRRQHHPDRIAA